MANLRSSFAASGGALDALADGAAPDDNGGGGGEAAQPRHAPLQQVQLLFGRSWCVPAIQDQTVLGSSAVLRICKSDSL